jgi:hypothetical protein
MPQNRMLTPAELKRFRIEHAADIASMKKRGTLFGATDETTPHISESIAWSRVEAELSRYRLEA